MSTEAAAAAPAAGVKPTKKVGLDASLHESAYSRGVMSKAMSVRRLVTNRHDDLLRSGSTHQLLGRPSRSGASSAGGGSLLAPIPGGQPAPPAGAAESLATEQTEEDFSDDESDFSGGSFCEADGDQLADREYLAKDLGASLHDEELEFDSGDDAGTEDLIAGVKNRMRVDLGPGEGGPGAGRSSSSS